MHGTDTAQFAMFSYVTLERRVPADHPLRRLRPLVDAILASMGARFDAVYSTTGRPSIPPERLLRALPTSESRSMTRWRWQSKPRSDPFAGRSAIANGRGAAHSGQLSAPPELLDRTFDCCGTGAAKISGAIRVTVVTKT